jgi:hypothetical protein
LFGIARESDMHRRTSYRVGCVLVVGVCASVAIIGTRVALAEDDNKLSCPEPCPQTAFCNTGSVFVERTGECKYQCYSIVGNTNELDEENEITCGKGELE